MFIWCDFYLDDFGLGRYAKLTANMDTSLLAASPPQQRDPLVQAHARQMKHDYEHEFTSELIDMRPGESVELFGAAFFNPLFVHSADVLVMRFVRIERTAEAGDNELNISAVVLENELEHVEIIFTPRVLTPYGRFGGVSLWCADVPVSVLDGERDHYNNAAKRICVICPSELFF